MPFITKENGELDQPVIVAIVLGFLIVVTVFLTSSELKSKVEVIIKEVMVPQYIAQEKVVEVTKEPQVINNNYYDKTNTISANVVCRSKVADCPWDQTISDSIMRHHARQKCIEESKRLECS